MAKVLILESIHLVRDKKRVEAPIGQIYDLTDDEMESLKKLRPAPTESGSSAFELPLMVEKEDEPSGKAAGKSGKASKDAAGL